MYGWLGYFCILGTVFIAMFLSIWTGGLQICAQAMWCWLVLKVIFLCSIFIMSQASVTTATTTSPPMTIVCSGTSSFLMTVTMTSTLMELSVTLGQHDVFLPPPLMLRDTRGVVDLTKVLQHQPQFKMPLHGYANYAMSPAQVRFSFRVEPHTDSLICIGICSGVYFLLSGTMLDAIFTNGGSTIEVCTIVAFQSIPMAEICATWWWSSAHTRNALSGCSLHCFE